MAEFTLNARSVFDAVGGCRVAAEGVAFDEAPARSLVSLAARRGQDAALAAAVKAALSLELPGPGGVATAKGVAAMFAAPGQWLLSAADGDLLSRVRGAAGAAGTVTDQSDAFVALDLSGPRCREALARLSSLDFDDAAFATGGVARTLMQQISVTIARVGDGPDYRLETARSTARDFADGVRVAVRAIEARRRLG